MNAALEERQSSSGGSTSSSSSSSSTSTTCNVYWTSLDDVVTEASAIKATCSDSSLKSCTITSTSGVSETLRCDSTLQVTPKGTSYSYANYFCACGGNPVRVPATVQCTDKCYSLTTSASCNVVWLTTGFTVGSPYNGVSGNPMCESFRCDSTKQICTDDGTVEYVCDNTQHDSQIASSSTRSYVCNCNGPAAIPSLYQQNGLTQGTACGGGSGSGSGSGGQATATTATRPATTGTRTSTTTSTATSTGISPGSGGSGAGTIGGAAPAGPAVEPFFGLIMLVLIFFRL